MTDHEAIRADQAGAPDEDLAFVYGDEAAEPPIESLARAQKRREFKPWHHPVKQIVRDRQWAVQTARLIGDIAPKLDVLRYFTLPGPDLLDVRVLTEVCAERGVMFEFFGFDSAAPEDPGVEGEPANVSRAIAEGVLENTRAALRQAGRITGESDIIRGRVEDIALERSHAFDQLRRRRPFHIINLDACSHLTYRHAGRPKNMFDAMRALLKHQMRAETPWLLFVTTRCEPGFLSDAGDEFKLRIKDNLNLSPDRFGGALAEAIETEISNLEAALASAWRTHNKCFLKLYSIGLGKFLLHLFNGQPNFPANVELVSAYGYSIHGEDPDMLAVAFRVTPDQQRTFPPSIGGMVPIPQLEPERAIKVVEKAHRLWDLDSALQDLEMKREAIDHTAALLRAANYDLEAWQRWVEQHPRRPIALDRIVAPARDQDRVMGTQQPERTLPLHGPSGAEQPRSPG